MPPLALPAGLQLRAVRRVDSLELGELVCDATRTYAEFRPGFVPRSSAKDNALSIRAQLAEPGVWMRQARHGQRAAGVVSFGSSLARVDDGDLAAGKLAYLKMLFVAPDVRGRGLAPALMSAARATMRSYGFTGAYLWTMAGNGRARRFYEREGFEHDGAARCHPDYQMDMVRYRTAL